MKLITVLFVFCVFTLTRAQNKRQQLEKECIQEVGVDKEDFKKIDGANTPTTVKCFVKCMMEKVGAMRDGSLVGNLLKKECKSTTGADACELAFNYGQCLRALENKKS